jgi:hypothetical protein
MLMEFADEKRSNLKEKSTELEGFFPSKEYYY